MRILTATALLTVLSVSQLAAGAEDKQQSKPAIKREKVRIGPATYDIPTTWKRERSKSEMRVVQYGLPAANGDNGKTEFVVFYFSGQGGGVEENLKRWRGMFQDSKDDGKTDRFTAGELKITTLDISGTYLDRPTPFAPEATPRKNYRMLNAVIETPNDGPYFLRLVGPKKSVEEQLDNWKHMLKTATSGN